MKFTFILVFISLFSTSILAQNSADVSGQLKDAGKVISRKKIKLVSQTQTFETTTDGSGNYTFTNIPDGNYLLVYGAKKARVRIEKGSVSISPLAEVVVVSSGATQPISEVSKTVDVIEPREMRERADFALVESLRTIPGFRVSQLGGFGRLAGVKTRGLRNQDTAVLIDGVRFRDAASPQGDASAFLSDITLTSVRRVEVLRGSGSSVYGSNAIGGVIDFHTAKPRKGFHGQLSGVYGGLGLKRVRGNVSDGSDDGKIGFNLGISRSLYSKGIDGDDRATNANIQSRVEYNPFARTNLSGRIFVADGFVSLNTSPDTIGALPPVNQIIDANQGVNFSFDANDPDNFQKSQFFSGQIALTQIINSKTVLNAHYQGLRTSRKTENGGLGPGFQPFGGTQRNFYGGEVHTFATKLNWTPNSIHFVTFGYEREFEKLANDGSGPTASGEFFTRVNQTSNSFFAQDVLSFLERKLQFAGGFRVQTFSLDSPVFSAANAPYSNLSLDSPPASYTFDGAASYYFTSSKTKFRAHIGNGYRAPSLYERFGTFYSSFSQSFTAIGDPNLKPEKSIAFDGGIDQSFAGNRINLSATYFYTKLIDTIDYANVVPAIGTTARPFGGYLQSQGGIARGLEFSGDVKATDSTEVFASYTFTNSDQRSPQVVGSGIIETLGSAKHQFTVVATQRFFDKLAINFDFVATSDYLAPIFSNAIFSPRIYRFRGQRRADLTGRYDLPIYNEKAKIVILGTIENLFDDEYYENGFRTIGRTGRFGLGVSF